MILNMDFPLDVTKANELYDGEKKNVIINKTLPIEIAGNQYYAIEYREINHADDDTIIGLVVKVGSEFYQVGLDSVSRLQQIFKSPDAEANMVDPAVVFDGVNEIGLAQTLKSDDLFDLKENGEVYSKFSKQNESMLTLEYNVPVDEDKNPVLVPRTDATVYFDGGDIANDNKSGFSYTRVPSFDVLDQATKACLDEYQVDGPEDYVIDIKVLEKTKGVLFINDVKNKRVTKKDNICIIPGIYRLVIHFDSFSLDDDMKSIMIANLINVDANIKKFEEDEMDYPLKLAGSRELDFEIRDGFEWSETIEKESKKGRTR